MSLIWLELYGLMGVNLIYLSHLTIALFGALAALFEFLATLHKRKR